jgi:hypothetical protein
MKGDIPEMVVPFLLIHFKSILYMEITNVKITKEEFQRTLLGFHGTEEYHRHALPNGMSLHLTDGCEFVRENAGEGAFWLFDIILSWQLKLRKHRFQVWKLKKQDDNSWFIECSDGNHNFIVGQEITYSDFPLDKFELWVIDGVALLPSEY